MNRDKATAFMERAFYAMSEVENAKDILSQDTAPENLRRAWVLVLVEFRKALRFMDQAARNLDRNRWADAMKQERKNNATLTYIFHARNADEHGVIIGYEGEPASLNVGNAFAFSGENTNITIKDCKVVNTLPDGSVIEHNIDGKFSTSGGRVSDGWLKTSAPVARRVAFLSLSEVEDRGKTYFPSTGICGEANAPAKMAQTCYNWTSKKMQELRAFD